MSTLLPHQLDNIVTEITKGGFLRSGQVEVVEWEWYDRLDVADCRDRDLYFFQHTQGSAVNAMSDTNCLLAGQLPRAFVCDGLAFMVRRRDRDRWEALSHSSSLEVRIGDRVMRVSHAASIPVLDQEAPIYRKVTREIRTPGRSHKVTTEEERVARWHSFAPPLIILPYRNYAVLVRFYPEPKCDRPLPLGIVLHGWDVRPEFP